MFFCRGTTRAVGMLGKVTSSTKDPRRGTGKIGALLPDRAAEDDPRTWGDERGDERGDENDDARFLDELPPHHRG